MRKKLLSLLIIVMLAAAAAFCLTACHKDDELATPKGIAISVKGVVSWKPVEGAEGYELRLNNAIVPCSDTSFDLLKTSDLTLGKQFTVRVRAIKGKAQSDWSDLVTYTYKWIEMTSPILSVNDGKLSWLVNGNASKIVLTIGGERKELPAATSQYDLSSLQQDSVILVQFMGDGVAVADSPVASIVYNVDSGKLQLTAPQNVRMEGYELTFDPVYGANIYYLMDVNNKVTTITGNRSDRTNLYFIKAVWAGDTRGSYEDGVHADVTYFAEGDGTQEKPFLIGSPEELRYVDFYERTDQAMYYKFKNDVILPSYAPGEEEVYANFYNLGSLSGVIDGDGHKLSNIIAYFCDGYSSLFDSITPSGVIKNLVIDNANFRTWTNLTNDGVMHEKGGECAVLAYTNRGTLSNVTVMDSYIYSVRDGAAALVSINKGTISNCVVESTAYIYGANEAGSIAIFNSGTISNCINRADVSGGTTIGGIVGRNNGVVSQCGNEGNVTATIYGGGIVGYNYNLFDEELMYKSTISQCYNYGNVSVVSYGGGIAGKNGGDGINEVGKVSPANAGIISCYNTGLISGANSIGGIVGDNYGFHTAETDLGVVNCYSAGEMSIDTDMLKSTRVYISLEECSWATDAGAALYMYYWGATGGVSWPGVRMTEVEIDDTTYFYADMNLKPEQLTGILFTRWNPNAIGMGDPWNQTADIKVRFTSGNLLFVINSSWKNATIDSSAELVDHAPISAGGIAGQNNMINDCYYLATKVNGNDLAAGVAQGEQTNKIIIGGTEAQSSACQIESSALSTLASTLNAYADIWTDSDDGPVLKWQKGE